MSLLELLPQQGRWRLLDEVVAHDDASIITTRTYDEAFAEGHFPEQLVVPGVALLESMAQSMLILARLRDPQAEGIPFLAGFDRVRFRAPVLPPATVRFEVRIVEERAGMTMATANAFVGEQRVCSAKLIGAVMPAPGQTVDA
ncbi:MAG: beta-hydroxyacyl-ACP dehydratase [Alphaproteobacteria bacterium]|nr:beta-hydroxyacyl-ACP dehydratase [Alphaproteobacteria bacterium]MCB9695600.1 beta-hydroxyacyl-ACP dehydratase [Alphaproteobacteria bacterium]